MNLAPKINLWGEVRHSFGLEQLDPRNSGLFATPRHAGPLNTAREAPTLASTLNIAAFNLGNALGAYLGGIVIDFGIGGGLRAVPWSASLVTLIGILFTLWGNRQSRRG